MYKIDQSRVRDNAARVNNATTPSYAYNKTVVSRGNVNVATILNDHDTIKNEIYKLRSQLHQVCQQASGTDNDLCERIKFSNRLPGFYDNNAPITNTSGGILNVTLSPDKVADVQRLRHDDDRRMSSVGVELVG
ncbi:hypothetical protein [Orgyia leucostigma nucleopolyhedrovirus]|uniref:Uncharacterized protein n=1 Tax=Orgyia leucostigma nucleopolyhedrovirus TaxID=490711 RepID=B0FDY3_9ABAC|nr:hypothetical protein [Orgyia leucostigma nucleopolyhedrovirus]ABY65841.1 hypothetical protein [Orgyia leucostigma nucleopolyhedrovirus]